MALFEPDLCCFQISHGNHGKCIAFTSKQKHFSAPTIKFVKLPNRFSCMQSLGQNGNFAIHSSIQIILDSSARYIKAQSRQIKLVVGERNGLRAKGHVSSIRYTGKRKGIEIQTEHLYQRNETFAIATCIDTRQATNSRNIQ